ncbi:hypothetical protein HRbin21_01295 [bacterium HR21]|nr:hypothetical protein HRbin21_01295 [bacterium HR21]
MGRCWIILGAFALVGVSWAQRLISPEQLRQAVEECVRKRLGGVPFEIRWLGEGRTLMLPPGAQELRCVSDSLALQQGRFLLEAWGGGRRLGRFVLSGSLWVVAPELRLRVPVAAGATVAETQVEVVSRRMSLSEYWERVRLEELPALRARRALPAGSPVLRRDWLSRAGVRRGERVTLVARSGAVEVRTRAQALEDGEPGSWVRVSRDGAARVVYARVLDATTVEVVPTVEQP